MVLGMKANNRRSAILQAEYIIHVKDIKPWPPSQSLNSLRSVMIQWENGSHSSGSTNLVVPSIGSVVGEGKIQFNESFKLSVVLPRVMSIRSSSYKAFQKNCLEFNLFEPRRDKAKGQLLATAVIDLAEYGILKEPLSVSAPLNCKRNFRNISQPLLFVDILPVVNSSPANTLSREMSTERSGCESVLALMNEEYAEEAAVPSLVDDEASSHSSLTVASSACESNDDLTSPTQESLMESLKDGTSVGFRDPPTNLITDVRLPHDSDKAFSSCSSALDISSDAVCTVRADTCFSNISEAASRPLSTGEDVLNALPLSAASQCMKEECAGGKYIPGNLVDKALEKVNNFQERNKTDSYVQRDPIRSTANCSAVTVASPERDYSFDKQATSQSTGATTFEDASDNITQCHSVMKVEIRPIRLNDEKNIQVRATDTLKDEQISGNTGNYTGEQILAVSEAHYTNKNYMGIEDSTNRLQHVKPVESLSNSGTRDVLVRNHLHEEAKEAVYSSGTRALSTGNQKALQFHSRGSGTFTDIRVQKLEQRIKKLEGELREAAAIEAALYSVVAEHGSSMNKFYAPARRLFRFYLHACEEKSRASAAKASVSGLVLVTKASGNDVPRLSFWLSNCVVLRAMISLATGYSQLPVSTGLHIERDDDKAVDSCRSSSLNWKEMNHINDDDFKNTNDWGDPQTYTSALEKVEGWIFSRIVESLWWQSLVPYMQCNEASFRTSLKSGTEHKGETGLNDQGQSNFSVQLWKEAFKDASEKLCPVRAERHDCGCLSVLSQLIMEQCIVRLDVAMFNAIFRNSVDEVPTDPISDPIGDPRVLPVPIGKSSFGAGAQLKNAIGNWSRRLNELFGLRDDKLSEDEREQEDEDDRQYASTKYFYLLNILSELMMLPKDLLLNNSIRKEVCPTFGARLIKRLLDTYIPDELCPELVPEAVLEALDCEEANEFGEDCISNVPCAASPPVYLPPSADSIACIIGETGNPELIKSGFSLLRKSYTSDDELEELHSPLSFIVMDGFGSSGTSKQRLKRPKKPDGLRYQLLREVWHSSP